MINPPLARLTGLLLFLLTPAILHATAGTITNVSGGAKTGISSVVLAFYLNSDCTGSPTTTPASLNPGPAPFNNGQTYNFDGTAVFNIIQDNVTGNPNIIQCFVATILDGASATYYLTGTGSTKPQFTISCDNTGQVCTSSGTANLD